MPTIAVNGLGRIGKLVLRALFHDGGAFDVVLLNDKISPRELRAAKE